MLKVQPRVHLGGADVGVTKELLYAAQITAGLQHMACKRVAQHVGVHSCRRACQLRTFAQTHPYMLRTQALATLVHKYCRL